MRWKQYTIDGVVTLAVPEGTTARREDGESLLVLTLPGDPRTDVLIGLFPLEAGKVISDLVVRERLADFMGRSVGGVAPVAGLSIAPAGDVNDPLVCAWQAVARIDGRDRWWLARLYGLFGGTEVLLAHWNGPAEQMRDVVLRCFVSIEALFSGNVGPPDRRT